ncbi:MAG: radical SAM protein [Actinomycetia bacterium]|nr:radical SAM protein [Actinomycetes bacterium]
MDKYKYLNIKAELLVEGIQATPQALEGVGEIYKEQNHGLFGWDFEDHAQMLLPDDFVLPDGTTVQFRKNSASPYKADLTTEGLMLSYRGKDICRLEWILRPKYYSKKTGSNQKMVKIGQIGGQDCLFFCYQNYCSHFAKGKQCLFCNLNSTFRTYKAVLKKKDIKDIGEVAREAFSEGMVKHVLLTGGCFSHQKEIEMVSAIVNSIKKHTGFDRVPGTILPSPPRGEDEIKRYYDTGIESIGFSMEIWDQALYKAICPGKSGSTSHQDFLRSIRAAVKIFGEGNVYGVFVMGIETKKTFLEGVRAVTSLGANVVPFVWSPNPGSGFEGHRPPAGRWFVETILEAADIVESSGIPRGDENHCYKCDGNSLLHDALRLRGEEA